MHRHAETIRLEEKVGAVAPTSEPNTLVAALEKDVVTINYGDPQRPRFKLLATTSADHGLPHEGWRFNDAKVTPTGVLIAGRCIPCPHHSPPVPRPPFGPSHGPAVVRCQLTALCWQAFALILSNTMKGFGESFLQPVEACTPFGAGCTTRGGMG